MTRLTKINRERAAARAIAQAKEDALSKARDLVYALGPGLADYEIKAKDALHDAIAAVDDARLAEMLLNEEPDTKTTGCQCCALGDDPIGLPECACECHTERAVAVAE